MFVLKYRDKKLDSFAPNDLPSRTKNGFSVRNIISFSNNSYITFSSEEEALGYIRIMMKQCNDERNVNRWNSVHWCADSMVKDIICSLKVCYEK